MMRAVGKLGATIIVLATIFGCSDPIEPEDQKVHLNTSFFLNYGETAEVKSEDLKITLTKVLRDDRCPANALCIWPGTAQIELSLSTGDSEPELFRIDLLADADSATLDLFSVDVNGYNVRLEQLHPYPGSERLSLVATPPEPPQIKAQLKITKGNPQSSIDGVVTIADMEPATIPLDQYQLDSAWVEADTLLINVTASGGCARHYYFLYMAPAAFAESNPAQAFIYLRHFANNDMCDGFVQRTLRFDISGIRLFYEWLYGKRDPIRLNVFDYFETIPGAKTTVLYEPEAQLIPTTVGSSWVYDVYQSFHTPDGDTLAINIVTADTITVSHSSELGGNRWWHLSGKNPKLVFGFDSFSYQGDTVIAMDACGDHFVRSRRFIPLEAGTQEYLMSDCFNSESVYAEVRADSIYYQHCRGCPDTLSFRTILPGTGIVAGEERSLWGDVSYRLKQFDPTIPGR